MDILVNKSNGLNLEFEIPADKSITHRAFMFASLLEDEITVSNYSKGKDCLSTLKMIEDLGCIVEVVDEKSIKINSVNAYKNIDSLRLDCGNSGTTMRLMSGILAGKDFKSELFGDESLSKRPMKRIIEPLELMGAKVIHNDYKAPLKFIGNSLNSITYKSKLSSAQVKSCVLLAGLSCDDYTTFEEPYKSRNHTELMLQYLGADIKINDNKISVKKSKLVPKNIEVVGDISSAAFFMVAGAIVPNSTVMIKNVGVNETRSGIIDVFKMMNADIEVLNERFVSAEKTADILVKTSKNLKSCVIQGEIIPRLIDELPVIAVLASQAQGTTIIKNAQDLRNKEADRIKSVVFELSKLGIDIDETPDGFIINGKSRLIGGTEHEIYHDHRIAMSLYIAGLICENPIKINDFQWVDISFPEFLRLINN